MQNPLLEKFNTPFDTAPFSKIKNEHFEPAFIKAIKLSKNEIDQIVKNQNTPSFENTVVALEKSGELLGRISSIFFNLNSAETSIEMQQIAQKVSPLLSQFYNDIKLNQKLFERVEKVYQQINDLQLSTEQKTLLEKSYKSFARNGAKLNEQDKEVLRKIDMELAQLSLKFGENILAETNNFELHLISEKDIAGLPKHAIDIGKETAQQKDKEGYIFTLDYPSYIPFVTYNDNRDLREKMVKAFGSKSFKNNEYNNEKIVLKIIELRKQRAKLLGYNSHCDFILEERMAKSKNNVVNFLNDLLQKSKPHALNEVKKLTEFAQQNGHQGVLKKWDTAYYSEKLKQKLFAINDEKLKPYFQLENVIEGVFTIAQKLYNINFKKVTNIDKYHDDIITYEVTDENNKHLAVFYADFFPREGKRGGAWMTSFKGQKKENGVDYRPHISIVCNFTKPIKDTPSLLTFNEVKTLFHEFGHALHGILANGTYESLSGTSVYWDFVELPSQILENWCYEKEALELFAQHYQTGEIIPLEYIQKIKKSASFMEASQTLRQVGLGLIDINWHSTNETITDVKIFEKQATAETELYPDILENNTSCAFSHIFQGGYSSGYYSYKWAEVLDADAFQTFKENGIFDNTTAQSFKENILSKGGSQHPMDLYKKFKGNAPSNQALLKRAGIVK